MCQSSHKQIQGKTTIIDSTYCCTLDYAHFPYWAQEAPQIAISCVLTPAFSVLAPRPKYNTVVSIVVLYIYSSIITEHPDAVFTLKMWQSSHQQRQDKTSIDGTYFCCTLDYAQTVPILGPRGCSVCHIMRYNFGRVACYTV